VLNLYFCLPHSPSWQQRPSGNPLRLWRRGRVPGHREWRQRQL